VLDQGRARDDRYGLDGPRPGLENGRVPVLNPYLYIFQIFSRITGDSFGPRKEWRLIRCLIVCFWN
jgi:hypothetical protein